MRQKKRKIGVVFLRLFLRVLVMILTRMVLQELGKNPKAGEIKRLLMDMLGVVGVERRTKRAFNTEGVGSELDLFNKEEVENGELGESGGTEGKGEPEGPSSAL